MFCEYKQENGNVALLFSNIRADRPISNLHESRQYDSETIYIWIIISFQFVYFVKHRSIDGQCLIIEAGFSVPLTLIKIS